MKHSDDDPVMVGYASMKNVSFKSHGKGDELGVTWGEWREMSAAARDELIQEYANRLVDVWVVDDED